MNSQQPHRLIQKSFKKRQKEDIQLSLRSLAEKIKISPGYLSKILAGKKPLNKKIIQALSHYLKMDELQHQQLLESYKQKIVKDKLGSIKTKAVKQSFSSEEYELLPAQSEWILSKWHYLCVLDLITTSNFRDDLEWIAKSLQIRQDDAAEALKSLERAKLIFRDNSGKLQKTYKKLRFPTKMSKEIIRQFHIAQMKRAINLLTLTTTSQADFDARLVTSLIVATNSAKIKQVKEFLHQALYQAADMLSDGDCQELYQLNLQFFPQTRKETETSFADLLPKQR